MSTGQIKKFLILQFYSSQDLLIEHSYKILSNGGLQEGKEQYFTLLTPVPWQSGLDQWFSTQIAPWSVYLKKNSTTHNWEFFGIKPFKVEKT